MVLLDTNVAIALIARPGASWQQLHSQCSGVKTFHLSSVVAFELWTGAIGSRRQADNISRLTDFLSGFTTIALDSEDARTAAEIRVHLKRLGTPIGPYDLLIAAQALRHNATLITANIGEFRRVPGLQWQDWSQPA